ncbi:MAG: CRISPR-associated endonuclease Cas1, partial [Myxococcota bacterium]
DLDTTRGIEGNAARVYFSGFNLLLAKTEPQCRMNGRNRRPPLDPVNALLSFVYTLLRHDVQSAASAAGLDPQVGFLHRDRPGRPGLASDLMEEFRPYIADRLSLSLLNRGQLSGSSFEKSASGAVSLNDDARKLVVTAYQERKAKETTHPYLNEKMTVGMLFHIQARLMARHLRGDLECYPSFFWK